MIPIVAGLLESGLSLLANAVLAKGKSWVQEKTGVDLDKANLSNEDMVKLRQFEMTHEEELMKLKLEDDRLNAELTKLYIASDNDARILQGKALAQDDIFSKRFIYYYAIFWSICASAYIGFITFGYIPKDNVRFADTILGFILGTVVAQIIAFFYGSSKSSQGKDKVIHEMLSKG
jgi:hypothetical protein